MALQNLHEMIRNLSSYIKSLEVLCESGVRLAKNFERLLSPGPVIGVSTAASSAQTQAQHHLDSDVLTQSVATWELAHKIATADANALISELLPLLQNTVESCMSDPTSFHSSNTYEVFRSCFSAFFQIQWRFCSLYIQCTSSQGGSGHSHSGGGYFSRSPPDTHLARSPTGTSFSSGSSGDRRESTESCMSAFSLPRSSISGLSALSSRSTSPSPGSHHAQHYGHGTRTRRSSPSVQFTPSQPPSPLFPCGEGMYPNLFRRWSAHTHNYSSNPGSVISGQSTSGNISAYSSGGSGSSSGSSGANLGFNTIGFSRRWSVPAACHNQGGSTSDSSRRTESGSEAYDYGLLDAINLLSVKPPSPAAICIEESDQEFSEQSTSLWPPSENMPGVVLTTCGTESDSFLTMENIRQSSQQTLQVPMESSVVEPPSNVQSTSLSQLGPHTFGSGSISSTHHPMPGEYSLFGTPSTSSSSHQSHIGGGGGGSGHYSA